MPFSLVHPSLVLEEKIVAVVVIDAVFGRAHTSNFFFLSLLY